VHQYVLASGPAFAINTRVGAEIDHIIIPCHAASQKDMYKNMLRGKTTVVPGVTKSQKQSAGGIEDPVRCRISSKTSESVYWQSLNIFICTLASKSAIGADTDVGQEFFILFKAGGVNGKINVAMYSDADDTDVKDNSTYTLRLRNRISLDSRAEVIHLDYAIVPIIPAKRLSEVVEDVLGQSPTVKNGTLIVQNGRPKMEAVNHLPMIKHVLCGLQVRCGYIPGTATSHAMILGKNDMADDRGLQIKDVRFPGDDTKFMLNGEEYTVPEYFEQSTSSPPHRASCADKTL
jgi:hypothetical protein